MQAHWNFNVKFISSLGFARYTTNDSNATPQGANKIYPLSDSPRAHSPGNASWDFNNLCNPIPLSEPPKVYVYNIYRDYMCWCIQCTASTNSKQIQQSIQTLRLKIKYFPYAETPFQFSICVSSIHVRYVGTCTDRVARRRRRTTTNSRLFKIQNILWFSALPRAIDCVCGVLVVYKEMYTR